ncbi:MAG: hypothetical protein ABFE07_22640 [Armatimonadia bacterium]
MSQLDLFAARAPAEPPTSYARTWRAHRLFARVIVAKSGAVWCYGYDLHASQSGEGHAPMPNHSRHGSFGEALEAGLSYLVARCKSYGASQWNDAGDYRRLLRMIEQDAPEVFESWEPDDEIQERWAACERAGLIEAKEAA